MLCLKRAGFRGVIMRLFVPILLCALDVLCSVDPIACEDTQSYCHQHKVRRRSSCSILCRHPSETLRILRSER